MYQLALADQLDDEDALHHPSPASSPLSSPLSSLPSSRAASPIPSTSAGDGLSANASSMHQDDPPIADKKRRNKLRSKASRKRKRAQQPKGEPRPNVRAKYVHSAVPEPAPYNVEAAPVEASAYKAARAPAISTREYTLEDLVGPSSAFGFREVKWDGRTTTPICDDRGRIVVVLAGQPNDLTWADVHQDAVKALNRAHADVNWASEQQNPRGAFDSLFCGISYGGGQTHPKNLRHSDETLRTLEALNRDPAVTRIAHFAADVCRTWAPRLYAHYDDYLTRLLAWDPGLSRNFSRSVWACIAYNFGPRTVTRRHRDRGNIPYGWCPVTALGDFDPTRGGHMVLWDLKLVIQFPPGSTILIPSAIVEHSNTAIAPHEKRYSITQYTPGGLFRWVDQGFQTQNTQRDSMTPEEQALDAQRRSKRWAEGLSYFSTVLELKTL
ncbi:hypothetical protein FISHEDRAFT_51263 [Fistulina hepatica ATCC 64428]|uniref:Uncharacterized protein n=1 Tax=Fistulina hepatica ATCC 64428 TaxID=1128425 RepID=A0A0D7A2G3_9AGAR|nr:hypothetical protein FISHEDRAFT_51263 [Fistulina hepatica ATCC 64428]